MDLSFPLMTLAGAAVDEWIHFTNSITSESPHRGSIGIYYGMSQNIYQLYENLGKDDTAFLREVQKIRHTTKRTLTTRASAQLCLTFVKWIASTKIGCNFVIRKGTTGMWIACRDTPLMVDNTKRYPLRFHYTVVGPVTEDIQRRIDAAYGGPIMPAVLNV